MESGVLRDMEAVEILKRARALIETPDKWVRGAFARDADGFPVKHLSDAACKFCARGAFLRAANASVLDNHPAEIFLDRAHSGKRRSYVSLNDAEETTHADILALFDRAIEKAEASK